MGRCRTQRRKQKPSRTDFGALDGVVDGAEATAERADAGVGAVGVTFDVALGGVFEPKDRMEHSKAHPRMLKSARETRGDDAISDSISNREERERERETDDARSVPRAGNATSHVWALGALAELIDKCVGRFRRRLLERASREETTRKSRRLTTALGRRSTQRARRRVRRQDRAYRRARIRQPAE